MLLGRRAECEVLDQALTDARAGTGLAGLTVRCRECGAARSLSGITGSGRQLGIACVGKQPWVYSDTPSELQEWAGRQVHAHLLKLKAEGKVEGGSVKSAWKLA